MVFQSISNRNECSFNESVIEPSSLSIDDRWSMINNRWWNGISKSSLANNQSIYQVAGSISALLGNQAKIQRTLFSLIWFDLFWLDWIIKRIYLNGWFVVIYEWLFIIKTDTIECCRLKIEGPFFIGSLCYPQAKCLGG